MKKVLKSLVNAELPKNLEVSIPVVDNNSTDDTKRVVEKKKRIFKDIKLEYLFEKTQGKS